MRETPAESGRVDMYGLNKLKEKFITYVTLNIGHILDSQKPISNVT